MSCCSCLAGLCGSSARRAELARAKEAKALAKERPTQSGACGPSVQHHGSEGNLLGWAVQRLVEDFDNTALGVEIHIGSMGLDPLAGTVEIGGLTVDNPPGFKSAYLLRADRVLLDVDMLQLATSLGRALVVEAVDLQNVDFIFEKALHSSNLHEVQTRVEASAQEGGGGGQAACSVTVHKVNVRNVGAKICSSLAVGFGPRLAVADISFADFAQQTGGPAGFMQVVRIALATLLKSVLASVVGKSATEHAAHGVGKLHSGISHALSGVVGHAAEVAAKEPRTPPSRPPAPPPATSPAARWCGAGWHCCSVVVLGDEGKEELVHARAEDQL